MVEQPALGHLGGGGDGVEGCGAFSGVNQQVDVGVEDVLARVMLVVCGGWECSWVPV